MLCALGADARAKNSEGKTALDYALIVGNMEAALILQKRAGKVQNVLTAK